MNPTVGIEIEMPVVSLATGAAYDARHIFTRLYQRRSAACGLPVEIVEAGGIAIGVKQPGLVTSVDNGFNNLESAIGPVAGELPGGSSQCGAGLNVLASLVHREINELVGILAEEGAGIINMAEHPATPTDQAFYTHMRAPKPIYDYWTDARGWHHREGIDAKAQNGPTTGVSSAGAVEALNLLLLAAPAFIALFGNSPFENGRLTGLKENRLTIWPRMFANASLPGDLRSCQPPVQPFHSLSDYFRWMFGQGTAMQALPALGGSYKGRGDLLRVDGDPALLDFLAGTKRLTRSLNGDVFTVAPEMRHFEDLQFSQFLDARIRFFFAVRPSIPEFLSALAADNLEALFEASCSSMYIEGRAGGAIFPDQILCDADMGAATSAIMSASALQKGLISNPLAYPKLQRLLNWKDLPALREAAIRDGLDAVVGDNSLWTIVTQVIEIAAAGLHADEHWMLAYPEYVLKTGQNGADRLIQDYEALTGDPAARMRVLTIRHVIAGVPHPIAAMAKSIGRRGNRLSNDENLVAS